MAEFQITGSDVKGYYIWTSPKYPKYRVANREENLFYVEKFGRGKGWEVQGIRGDFNGVRELMDYLEMEEYADMYGNEFALMEG